MTIVSAKSEIYSKDTYRVSVLNCDGDENVLLQILVPTPAASSRTARLEEIKACLHQYVRSDCTETLRAIIS